MHRSSTRIPFEKLSEREQEVFLKSAGWPLRFMKRAWGSCFLDKPELQGLQNPEISGWGTRVQALRKGLPSFYAAQGWAGDVCRGIDSALYALEERLLRFGSPLSFLQRTAVKLQSGDRGSGTSTELLLGSESFLGLYYDIAGDTAFATVAAGSSGLSISEVTKQSLARVDNPEHRLVSSDLRRICKGCQDLGAEDFKYGIIIFTANPPAEHAKSAEIIQLLPRFLARQFALSESSIQAVDGTSEPWRAVQRYVAGLEGCEGSLLVLPEEEIPRLAAHTEGAELYKKIFDRLYEATPGLVIAPHGHRYFELEGIFGR